MSKHNDKYTIDGDDESQVRNIIRRLNEDRPAQEKSREVVVRADGSKAIRVTKKRKMMMTNEERNRRSRRSFVMILLVGFLVCAAFVVFFMYRMTSMTGSAYLSARIGLGAGMGCHAGALCRVQHRWAGAFYC